MADNLWIRLPSEGAKKRVISGSHSDSVIEGGNYDGLAGIVAALACACWMKQEGIVPLKHFDVVCWRCEEQGLYGCRGYSLCQVNPDDLMTGRPLEVLSDIEAYYELHIEQGPKLDSLPNSRVGLVSGIRGNVYHRAIRIVGQTAHSGAIEKEFRHDAFVALSTLNVRMVKLWQDALDAGEDLVYTIGVVNTPASASFNVIPGEVTFSLDIRTLNLQTRERFYALFKKEAARIEEEFGVQVVYDNPSYIEPVKSDETLLNVLVKSAEQCQIPAIVMPSGAGHDAQVMGQNGVPMAMIFVANQNGSHNPKEAMRMQDFVAATQVLMSALEVSLNSN